MQEKLILIPLLGQVLLTAIVFFRMYYARVKEMRSKRIHPQKMATANSTANALEDSTKIADNFTNQFEMPVLFYVLIICLYLTQMTNMIFFVLAWVFVVLRFVHSLIHCSYNKVIHRFYAYAASSFVLWVMWAYFAVRLLLEAG